MPIDEKADDTVYIQGAEDREALVRQLNEEERIMRCQLTLPSEHLSVSQVRAYQRCPRQYYFKYIEKLPGTYLPSNLMEGRALHKALETVLRGKQHNQDVALDALDDVFRETWKADAQKVNAVVYTEGEDENSIQRRGGQFLRRYKAENLPHIEPIGVEEEFNIRLTEYSIPVRGFIDLIDMGEEDKIASVVDHKVLGRARSQGELDNDMQLTLYAHKVGTPKVRLDMFVKNKTPIIKTVRSLRRSTDIQWVERIFTEVARAISAGVFPPCDPMSFYCRKDSCDFYTICREGSAHE